MAPNDQKNDSNATLVPEEGDTVSWKWAGGQPTGTVVDVKTGETQISSKNGNTIARHGTKADPALNIVSDTTGSKVLKKASEVNVEEKASSDSEKTRGEKRSEPEDDKTVAEELPEAKKLKATLEEKLEKRLDEKGLSSDDKEVVKKHLDNLDKKDMEKLHEKLEGKGLANDDKELVKEHVEELTKEDMKEPVSRRTRSQEKEDAPVNEARIAKEIFKS